MTFWDVCGKVMGWLPGLMYLWSIHTHTHTHTGLLATMYMYTATAEPG